MPETNIFDTTIFFVAFNIFIGLMILLDLRMFRGEITIRKALIMSAGWIALAMLFNVGIYFWHPGAETAALEFLSGYLIEKSLSVDNLFVFLIIFSAFKLNTSAQHTILFYGIVGAIIMRVIFISVGIELMNNFHWLIYVFGLFLIYSGYKLIKEKDPEIDFEKNKTIRFLKKNFRFTDKYSGKRFFVKIDGVGYATPMLLALILVESTDLIFALDSIPAIMAVTNDFIIIYTSNIFAILGLRSLYFALAGLMKYFKYLNYGLAIILVFVGVKMMLKDVYHIPIHWALLAVLGILASSILASIISVKKERNRVR